MSERRKPETLAEAVSDLKDALRTEIWEPFENWMTPRRLIICLALCWTVLIMLSLITWRIEPIAIGVVVSLATRLVVRTSR